jgi:hypothetical protein
MNAVENDTFDLGHGLLGPPFETQTPESFQAYVMGLKDIKAMGKEKPVRKVRVKREPKPHTVDAATKKCVHCGKKPRKPDAKCDVATKAGDDAPAALGQEVEENTGEPEIRSVEILPAMPITPPGELFSLVPGAHILPPNPNGFNPADPELTIPHDGTGELLPTEPVEVKVEEWGRAVSSGTGELLHVLPPGKDIAPAGELPTAPGFPSEAQPPQVASSERAESLDEMIAREKKELQSKTNEAI